MRLIDLQPPPDRTFSADSRKPEAAAFASAWLKANDGRPLAKAIYWLTRTQKFSMAVNPTDPGSKI